MLVITTTPDAASKIILLFSSTISTKAALSHTKINLPVINIISRRATIINYNYNYNIAAAAVALILVSSPAANAIGDDETLSNVPQTLSSSEKTQVRIQRPKSTKSETCTSKCVSTCIQGGFGSPGEGLLNIRRPLVVFKDGFRSRKYCLGECSDICNLIGDGDDGP
ncbi:uncharacterized protein [Henckelia pumila]|uniref:uncharacterized protein n=1 Tax=Henckelia pumila TaxID=405737 RepID=UPI003C6E4040